MVLELLCRCKCMLKVLKTTLPKTPQANANTVLEFNISKQSCKKIDAEIHENYRKTVSKMLPK